MLLHGFSLERVLEESPDTDDPKDNELENMELDEAPEVLEDQSVDEDEIMEEVLTPGAAMEEQEAGQ